MNGAHWQTGPAATNWKLLYWFTSVTHHHSCTELIIIVIITGCSSAVSMATWADWSQKSTRSMRQSNDTSWLLTPTTHSQNSRLWYLSTSKNDVTTTRLANLRPARLCCAFWLSSMSLNSTNIYKVNTHVKQMSHNNILQRNTSDDAQNEWFFPIADGQCFLNTEATLLVTQHLTLSHHYWYYRFYKQLCSYQYFTVSLARLLKLKFHWDQFLVTSSWRR